MTMKEEGAPTGSGSTVGVAAKPRVRDRIFQTACDLFYQHGIRAVGVDAIATEAGTNKMSFYRAFGSKEELVRQYLLQQTREYFEYWDETVKPYQGKPRAQIEALFRSHAQAMAQDGCRGCALGNAAVEIGEEDDALAQVVREYKGEVRARLRALARELGALNAAALGDSLMLLMDGAYFTRLAFASCDCPAQAIISAANALIDAATPVRAGARTQRRSRR
jgi:AcrR family transcriptional regulator